MPLKNVEQSSFINLFPEITDENNYKILDIWNSFRVTVIPETYNSDAYFEYIPKVSDNLYNLAYRFYGSPKMWWVIPLVNDAEDPFDFLQTTIDNSSTIKVLKNEYINTIMFSAARMKNVKDN